MRILLLSFPLFLLIAGCTARKATTSPPEFEPVSQVDRGDEEAILETFAAYKNQILNDMGSLAVNLVSESTIAYYQKISDLTRTADSTTVSNLPLLDKMTVLLIRHRTPADKITGFNGKSLFVYSINEGMISKGTVATVSVGHIVVNEDFATTKLEKDGEFAPFGFDFYREGGRWKIDLTSVFSASAPAFRAMVESSGQSENAFLMDLMQKMNGMAAKPSIWYPVE